MITVRASPDGGDADWLRREGRTDAKQRVTIRDRDALGACQLGNETI
jgi:hypothetical protein